MAAMFVESALVYSGSIDFRYVPYYSPFIFKFPPELWRLVTTFLLTGNGISFVIDLYFSGSQPPSSCMGADLKSVDVQYWFGVKLSALHPAWRLLHLHPICCLSDLGESQTSTFLTDFVSTPHISARSALFLAEAVPGDEEDYPYGTCSSDHSQIYQGLHAAWAWWESFEKKLT